MNTQLIENLAEKFNAPAILTQTKYPERSDRYAFLNTNQFLEEMIGAGFEPRSITQARTSAKNSNRKAYARHMIRFTHPNLAKYNDLDSRPEIIFDNEHGAKGQCARLLAGMYSFACANGHIIGSASFMNIKIHHVHAQVPNISAFVGQALGIVDSIVPAIELKREASARKMAPRLQYAFAEAARELRWPTTEIDAPRPAITNLLDFQHEEDADPTFWNVYNRIQGWTVSGGINVYDPSKANQARRARAIRNMNELVRINTGLWNLLAEAMH